MTKTIQFICFLYTVLPCPYWWGRQFTVVMVIGVCNGNLDTIKDRLNDGLSSRNLRNQSFLMQWKRGRSSFHVMSCCVLSCHVMSCLVMSCYVLLCRWGALEIQSAFSSMQNGGDSDSDSDSDSPAPKGEMKTNVC